MDEVLEIIDRELGYAQQELARWRRTEEDHRRAAEQARSFVDSLTKKCDQLVAAKNILNGGC